MSYIATISYILLFIGFPFPWDNYLFSLYPRKETNGYYLNRNNFVDNHSLLTSTEKQTKKLSQQTFAFSGGWNGGVFFSSITWWYLLFGLGGDLFSRGGGDLFSRAGRSFMIASFTIVSAEGAPSSSDKSCGRPFSYRSNGYNKR